MASCFSICFGAQPDEYGKIFKQGEYKVERAPVEVYHCTLKDSAEKIVQEGFRFPVKGETENRGWKLGYAVYFGVDPEYCIHEALNTFADEGRKPDLSELVMIKAQVVKGKYRALGDYDTLDGKCGVDREKLDALTENLHRGIVAKHGYDTLTINEGQPRAEVAVFDPRSIGKLEIIPAAQFASNSRRCAAQ
eukprot:TRINITY_DN75168_c0_g1_i1.p1 TRINITY_DN75168_c0_g1~~TRINITY_DN75168_c0_g1_i1.p1  ORF type:complete len:192 (-),score=34.03 TRINITY_DN75168_c0_g1_i1:254-829(-)